MAYIQTSKGKLHYKPQTLYVGIKQINKEISIENLEVVNKVLRKNGVRYSFTYGTLLGAIREHDFIAWDEDIDLYVLGEDEEKLKDSFWELIDEGFELLRYDKFWIYSIGRNGEYIDFYIYKKLDNEIRYLNCNAFFMPTEITDNIINYEFKGGLYPVPRDYEKFLVIMYGKNWMTPLKYANFEMSWFQKTKMKLFYIIKRNMPDFIYIPWSTHYHKPLIEKFNKKFKDLGLKTIKK